MSRGASTLRRLQACSALCCLLAWAPALAQKPLRDPFVRPAGMAARPATGPGENPAGLAQGAGLPAATTAAQTPGTALTPELRAVVFDGPHSLANLGGQIFGIGESIDGYRLLSVEERSAVFAKDGARIRIMLDKEKSK